MPFIVAVDHVKPSGVAFLIGFRFICICYVKGLQEHPSPWHQNASYAKNA